MSGCNCKNKNGFNVNVNNTSSNTEVKKSQDTTFNKVVRYTLKVIGFLLMVALLPIINLFIIWFIFRTLVLTKEVDIKPMIKFVGAKLRNNTKDEEIDYENLKAEDFEILDVEEIKN